MTKWIIIAAVVVIAGIGLWWSGIVQSLMTPKAPVTQQATTTPQQTQTPVQTNDLPTGTTDASDAAMVQDAAAIDAQLQSLASDSTNIDSSLNDKSVSQEF